MTIDTPYEEGTKVFYWSRDNTLKRGIVTEFIYDPISYYCIETNSGIVVKGADCVNIDKKKLLLHLLDIFTEQASVAKQRMLFFNERIDKICSILQKEFENIDIKKELEEYKNNNENLALSTVKKFNN